MVAQAFRILDKQQSRSSQVANITDFSLAEAQSLAAGVVLEPNISLYCLDPLKRQAVFVDLPEHIDLARAPFVYQTQFDHARRLISLPYDVFLSLADTLVEPAQLILLYSTGRCGSTLLHSAFNELDTIVSFSENDVLSQFIHLRSGRDDQAAELERLLKAAVRFVIKPSEFKTPTIHALKFRNQCVEIIDLFHKLYPQAKALFLYRNALDWVRSIYRLASRNRVPPDHDFTQVIENASLYLNRDMTHFRDLFPKDTKTISATQQITLWWLGVMEGYRYWRNRGVPVSAWRYEDLSQFPETVLESLFDYCELPRSDVKTAFSAFAKDSQENTRFARDEKDKGNQLILSEEQHKQIQDIFTNHPFIQSPYFVAP